MTQLPQNPNQTYLDSLIQRNRAVNPTPQAILDRRNVERLTIGEINTLNQQGLKAGIAPTDYSDDRSPLVRFLDTIDLPRNTVANIAFGEAPDAADIASSLTVGTLIGGIAGAVVGGVGGAFAGGVGAVPGAIGGFKAGASAGALLTGGAEVAALGVRQFTSESDRNAITLNKPKGAGGQPAVYFSDALKRMGVDDPLVRGVVGFGGDMLMDPLTYMSAGSNTVKWTGRGGKSVLVGKPASKAIDDIAGIIERTGQLPTDPAYKPFVGLYQSHIKIGDELIDATGTGANLRDRMLEAIQKVDGSSLPLQNKRQIRQRIAQVLKEDAIETARWSPIDPDMPARAGIARDFFRRYGATSDFQYTVPLTNWLSNRLRLPLEGRQFILPTGRIGRAATAKRLLRGTEAEFVAEVGQETAEKAAALGVERLGIVEGGAFRVAKESIPADLPTSIRNRGKVEGEYFTIPMDALGPAERQLVTQRGFATTKAYNEKRLTEIETTLGRLDAGSKMARKIAAESDVQAARINLDTAKDAEAVLREAAEEGLPQSFRDAEAARQGIKAAEYELALTEGRLKDAIEPRFTDLFSARDRALGAFAAGDSATAAFGPSAMLRHAYNRWTGGKWDTLDAARSAALRQQQLDEGMIRAQQYRRADILRRVDPMGVGTGARKNLAEKLDELTTQSNMVANVRRGVEAGATLHLPMPSLPAAIRQALSEPIVLNSVKGKRGIQFANEIDRVVWFATQPRKKGKRVIEALKREARQYVMRTFGVTEKTVYTMGKRMRKQIRELSRGTEGDIVVPVSKGAANRAKPLTILNQKTIDKMERVTAAQLADTQGKIQLVDDALDDIKTLEDAAKLSAAAARKILDDTLPQIEAMKDSTFYRVLQGVQEIENAYREAFRVGRDFARKDIRVHRREVQVKSQYVKEQLYADRKKAIETIMEKVPDTNPAHINGAIEVVIADRAAKNNPALHGFATFEGEPMDEILKLARTLRADERTAGLFDKETPAGKLIAEFADDHNARSAKQLAEEQAVGLLRDFDPKTIYTYGTYTEQAKAALREMEERIGKQGVRVGGTLTGVLPFQMRRVTNRMFWKDADGNVRYIYGGELMDATSPNAQEFLRWREQFIQANRLPDDWMPPEFATSAMHINANRSEFGRRVSAEFTGPIMEEDIVLRDSARTLLHEHAMAAARLKESVLPHSISLTEDEAQAARIGLGGRIKIDGVEYKRLEPSKIGRSELSIPIDERDFGRYYPAALVDELEAYAKQFPPGTMANLLKPIEAMQTFWKKLTLAHPSYWVGNMVGNAFNSYAKARSRPENWIRHAKSVQGIVRKIHDGKPLTDNLVEFAGKVGTERELAEMLISSGAVVPGRVMGELLSVTRMGPMGGVNQAGIFGKIKSPFAAMLGWWWRVNAKTDDIWRAITLADLLEQGKHIDDATDLMRQAHFDYLDMSAFEHSFARKAMPFYAWVRNNAALQVSTFLERPAIAASFPKLKNAIEEQFDDEQYIPEELRPRWMRDNLGVQIKADPQARFLLLSLFTPIQDLFEIGQATMGTEGVVELLKYVVSSSSPLIKMPFEIWAGQEFFTGREIGDPDLGKVSHMQYLASQFRPYREYLSTTRMLSAEDIDATDYIARYTLGGKLQQASREKLEGRAAFDFGQTSQALRRQIKLAINDGNDALAQRLSVRLTEQYRKMWNLGLMESVPKELRARFRREAIASKPRSASTPVPQPAPALSLAS